MAKGEGKVVAQNKKARHDYTIVDTLEAGMGNIWNQEPERRRKLLLHKKQIQKLEQETKGTGMTLVPLKVYIKDGYAKLLLGLAKGKHDYDKRESIKRREQNRDIARVMKAVNQR